ncbi:uncharacterized protein [Rutidosis leptorrhynchoides]
MTVALEAINKEVVNLMMTHPQHQERKKSEGHNWTTSYMHFSKQPATKPQADQSIVKTKSVSKGFLQDFTSVSNLLQNHLVSKEVKKY